MIPLRCFGHNDCVTTGIASPLEYAQRITISLLGIISYVWGLIDSTIFTWMRGIIICKSRIMVVSDTHGRFEMLYHIVQTHAHTADLLLHAGDGEQDVKRIRQEFPDLPVVQVQGNCDVGSTLSLIECIHMQGKRIVLTHGHLQHVKYGLGQLQDLGVKKSADVVIYGHTHQSYSGHHGGLYIFNPGSPAFPRNGTASYGILDITTAGVTGHIYPVSTLPEKLD